MKSLIEILSEGLESSEFVDDQETLEERFVYKVNAKGKKRKKLKCAKGMKPNQNGTSCVPMRAAEKRNQKVGHRHAVRTVRAKGNAAKTRKVRKTRKAMRYRKNLGL